MGSFYQMLFFRHGQGVPEQCCLGIMIFKAFTTGADFVPFHLFRVVDITSRFLWGHFRFPVASGVGPVVYFAFIDGMPHETCLLMIMYRGYWAVDGKFRKICTVKAVELS